LPFKPLVAGSGDEYLEIGIADSLITKLSAIHAINVRPTSAVQKFAGAVTDPISAGRELQVGSVLEGSIQRVGDRVRVSARLVNVDDSKTLWADQFDEKFTDIFTVEDDISQKVAARLALQLSRDEQARLTKRYTQNSEAYQLYLKGQYFWNKFNPEASKTAVEYFNQALAHDPAYALAYVGLGNAYGVMGVNNWLPPKDVFPKAEAAAQKALEIDEGLAEAHSSLGAIEMFYEWDWTAAERELRRAIELNPNEPNAHGLYSYLLTATGRFDEAIAQTQLNLRLNPLSPITYADMARAFYYARRYEEAIAAGQQALEMDTNFVLARLTVGEAYEQKGMYEESFAELRKVNESRGGFPEALGAIGHAYAVAGRRDEALKTLEELQRISTREYVSSLQFAMIYAGLGEKEKAIEQLESAADDRAGWLINLGVDPRFDALRSEPRYQAMLRRLGIAR
jgi:TolB-like protein